MKKLLNEKMSFEDIFKILTKNKYRFVKEKFDKETGEILKTEYKSLPEENCWLYHPNGETSILFTQKEGVKQFIKYFNEWYI